MAILIANIGTSDLAVKIEEYYIPVGFDRNEPNIDYSDLTEDEKIMWEQQKLRQEYITEYLCPELNVAVDSNNPKNPFSFLELTEKLLNAYQQDEEKWHPRIRPGRISGVIQTAVEKFKVKDIYIFVTKQKDPHPQDSIYLFDILQKWFKKEQNIQLIPEIIPANIPAVDLDNLLDYYYGVFVKYISKDSELFISLKGGTPQMKTAISMQAFASSINKQIFIDPVLSPAKILAGKPSDCLLTSYWRYMRNQKYQDVKILLEERWDFDGAIQLIEQWQDTLKFLSSHLDDIKISQINHLISQVIRTLKIANYCFNLDWKTAQSIVNKNSAKISGKISNQFQPYSLLLNLYTLCHIYYELNQMANFLVGVSSFYEKVLEIIAKNLGKKQDYPERGNRYEKLYFLDERISKNSRQYESWLIIKKCLNSLNFWCSKRNRFIHHGEGISQELMHELYSQTELFAQRGNQYEREDARNACSPDSILDVMTEILETDFNLLPNQYQRYVGTKSDYYIYSAVRKWAIDQLMDEGLK
ncbi:hypothetical protein [Okeania sp. SIO2B3]|uniref:hypothetical protein n=1 Tax=Okeania sp. SIO2B3 TaxID=2607784 RepID=UPI0013C0A2CA|nr:hypothetical protein [Okeania sp. SIO2B3]NET45368.1 hypothetical protein [Okeania sp. SIO2B3]